MTGREILLAYLTENEALFFARNASYEYINEVIDKEYGDVPHTIISEAFTWDTTPEGRGYWREICNRIRNGKTDILSPKKRLASHGLTQPIGWVT